jgi:hypothetical protein
LSIAPGGGEEVDAVFEHDLADIRKVDGGRLGGHVVMDRC